MKTYVKCPKISHTKVSDKMAYANSTDSDQTAPEVSILRKLHKKQNLGLKIMK